MIFNRFDCESNDIECKDVNAMIYNCSDFESNDVVECDDNVNDIECEYSMQ
jgi:hypothetical protein